MKTDSTMKEENLLFFSWDSTFPRTPELVVVRLVSLRIRRNFFHKFWFYMAIKKEDITFSKMMESHLIRIGI